MVCRYYYIRMVHGFTYLLVIIDWYSRYILSWRLSNMLDADFCVEASKMHLEKANRWFLILIRGHNLPARLFIGLLEQHGIKISMDGKGSY